MAQGVKPPAVAPVQVTITGLNPPAAQVGGNDFPLTISGTGFDATNTNTVSWKTSSGTYNLPTNLINGQLVVTIPASFIATSGSATITVTSTAGTSAAVTYTFSQSLPEGVDLLLGIGTSIRGPISDYTITNNYMAAKNLGWAIPEALVGISVPVDPKSKIPLLKNLGVFASAQFSSSTGSSLLSYTFGLSVHMNRYMHFLVGYSLQPTNQPAVGFRNAAASYVASVCPTPTSSTCVAPYNIFNPSALRNNSLNAFDGFPVPAVSTSGFTYAGTSIETAYKSGVFIGFAFPLSFKSGLEGGQ